MGWDISGKNNPRWIGGKINVICSYCKKYFKSYPSSKSVFCSMECEGKDRTLHPKRKRAGKIVFCNVCNKQFYLPLCIIGKNNYCSLICLYSIRLGKPNFGNQREKNGQWKGGVTTVNAKIRASLEYTNWRRKVFERDLYKCIWCNIKGGWNKELKKQIVLNADHIKPFALYPELRFELNNGRTLCEDCHMKTSTFGKLLKHQIRDML